MQKQAVDHLTLENLVSSTSLESLVHGYILNCRCEGKSPKTPNIYEMVLRNFIWYCRHSEFQLEPQKLGAMHIRQFMLYLSNEVNRWDSASPLVKRRVSTSTAHDYYRALHSFFNWLEREELIHDNPFTHLKPPKIL